ncbi:MAG: acyl-CoA dehydrogenase family protein [Thermoanaerobaculum sp.]|nr:acyl-CoA dehydrogenase family protein [Thermoanaerobaculum sp.]
MLTEATLSPEQRAIRRQMQEFTQWVPRQLLLDLDAERVVFAKEFLQEAGRRQLLGLRFPTGWGGRGLPWTVELVALEEIGVLGTTLACLWSLVSKVGEAIACFGTSQQKQRYLVPMLRGELAVAEALTEPRGGSDFFAATTVARRHGDAFVLDGQKRFVVGAEGADLFRVYARLAEEEDPKKGMTAFLVERGPGLEVRHVYGLMGTRGGGTGRLLLRNCLVPVENVLGGEAGVGRGFEVFHQMMIPERLTSAGGAIGMARAALEVAARYADRRRAFGQKIRHFQGVSFKIAESLTVLDAARALNLGVAAAVDAGEEPSVVRRLVSEAKLFATETAWNVVNQAMQILGGIGYTNVYPVERLLRDIRLITIWTGTNEIMRAVIQHEFYRRFPNRPQEGRAVEQDAAGAQWEEEKVYGDEEPEKT